MNVSLHSSFLRKSCAYMAEEVHSSVAGLTALHWEVAKTRLNSQPCCSGQAGSLRFSHHLVFTAVHWKKSRAEIRQILEG